jgi:hypothetical protein
MITEDRKKRERSKGNGMWREAALMTVGVATGLMVSYVSTFALASTDNAPVWVAFAGVLAAAVGVVVSPVVRTIIRESLLHPTKRAVIERQGNGLRSRVKVRTDPDGVHPTFSS